MADAGTIEVVFADGTTSTATIVTGEPTRDIAVLEADRSAGAIVPAVLANSRTAEIGDPIFAVGNPLGLTGSLSAGVISGLDRDIPADGDVLLSDLIQFDAAVNQGSSGGPLLDQHGSMIGIVTALADPSSTGYFIGIGFAVPIDLAVEVSAKGPFAVSQPTAPADAALLMEHVLFEVKKVIVGQDVLLERLIIGLLARGHILVEGVPGLAKTMAIKSLSDTIGGESHRISSSHLISFRPT